MPLTELYKSYLATMVALGIDERSKLLDAMDSAPKASSMDRLEAHITKTSGLAATQVQRTLIVAGSLLAASGNADVVEFARATAHETAAEGIGGLTLDDTAAVSAFSDFILGLIRHESTIGIAAKPGNLIYIRVRRSRDAAT